MQQCMRRIPKCSQPTELSGRGVPGSGETSNQSEVALNPEP